MKKIDCKKSSLIFTFILFIIAIAIADDSINNPILAEYCDGNSLQIYPLSVADYPDFSINVTPPQRSIYAGENTFYTVVVQSKGGFSEPVTLSFEGLPEGATGRFDDNPLKPTGETKFRVETSSGTPAGTYIITIIGTAGELSHSATVILEIKGCPDFSVEIRANPEKGRAPLEVKFEAIVITSGDDSPNYTYGDNSINYTYFWNFGDGMTSSEKDPVHTYTRAGTYKATVVVKNECGIEKKAEKEIKVFSFEGVIIKYFSERIVLPGNNLSMFIEVENKTNYDFENVEIWDELSPYLVYLGDNAPSPPVWEGRKIKWILKSLEKWDRLKIEVRLKVAENAPEGRIENTAYLYHNTLEQPIPSNLAVIEIPKVKVDLEKKVDKTSVRPGETLNYRIIIVNSSSIPLNEVKVKDELSENLEFISQEGEFKFRREDKSLTWEGRIEANKETTINFTVRVKENVFAGTRITNYAILEAKELRKKIISNTVSTDIFSEPIPISKVRFSKKSDIPQTEVGRIVRFRLTVENDSESWLISSSIEDILPQGFSYIPSSTTLNGEKFTDPEGTRRLFWRIPIVKPKQTLSLAFQVIIGADARRGKNVNKAVFKGVDNSGQNIILEASEFINVSASSFIFYSGVEGFVYIDKDRDGFYSASDIPLKGVEVRLSTGEKVYTDPMGHYLFDNLYPGEYALGIKKETLPQNSQLDSPSPVAISLFDGLIDRVDFRLTEREPARIKGVVYFDRLKNGQFDSDDTGVKNIKIILHNHSETFTDDSGNYSFSNVAPGKYRLSLLESSLPKGCKLASDKYFEIDINYGEVKEFNFALTSEPFLKVKIIKMSK